MTKKKRTIIITAIVITIGILACIFYFAYLKEEIRWQKCLKYKKEIDRMIEEGVNEIPVFCPGC